MKTRIKTGLILALILSIVFTSRYFFTGLFDLLLGVMAIVGCMEISSMYNNSGRENSLQVCAFFIPLFYIILQITIIFDIAIWIFALMCFGLLCVSVCFAVVQKEMMMKKVSSLLTKKERRKELFSFVANTKKVIFYPGILFILLILINNFEFIVGLDSSSIYLSFMMLAILFAVTCLTDICAYFVGMKVRGKKLAPKISPNKTISGAIGGLIGGVCASMLLYLIFNNITVFSDILTYFSIQWWLFLVIGFVGATVSQMGDLFESYLKRKCNVKDSGNLFAGHGGMMDRVDGILFNVVFLFIIFLIIVL